MGPTLQSLNKIQLEMKMMKLKLEPIKATMMIMEDNLKKAEKALMKPKIVCATTASLQEIESKPQPDQKDRQDDSSKAKKSSRGQSFEVQQIISKFIRNSYADTLQCAANCYYVIQQMK